LSTKLGLCFPDYPGFSKKNSEDHALGRNPLAFAQLSEGIARNRQEQWHDGNGNLIPHWWLSALATDPAYQRRGFGTKLIDWGFDQADSDGVVAGMMCSTASLPYYLKKNFVHTGEVRFGPHVAWVCERCPVRSVGGFQRCPNM
jgi:GNAT superfamily N-acetyltransferase